METQQLLPLVIETPEGFVRPAAFGRETRLGYVQVDMLRIDKAYQREVDSAGRAHVLAIANAFEWSRFGAILVAPCGDGTFAIIDGQHRALAALLCGIAKVPCVVIFADRKRQAASFAAVNGTVKPVTLMNVFKAAKAAQEPWALTADAIVAAAGCRLMDYNTSADQKKPGEVYCIGFFRDMAAHGESAPLRLAAGLALQSLKLASSAAAAEAWVSHPIQALSEAIYRLRLWTVHPAVIARKLDLIGFMDVCNSARLTVATRRKMGQPSLGVTEQLTEDLVDLLGGVA